MLYEIHKFKNSYFFIKSTNVFFEVKFEPYFGIEEFDLKGFEDELIEFSIVKNQNVENEFDFKVSATIIEIIKRELKLKNKIYFFIISPEGGKQNKRKVAFERWFKAANVDNKYNLQIKEYGKKQNFLGYVARKNNKQIGLLNSRIDEIINELEFKK